MGNAEQAVEIFKKGLGTEETPGEWHTVDQDQINLFAEATGDHQFIHVDPERAAQTPFGTTVAHGFLTLSLLPFLQASIPAADPAGYQGLAMGVNYGLNKVRFFRPVRVGSRIRAVLRVVSTRLVGKKAVRFVSKITIEVDGADKPACVAETVTLILRETNPKVAKRLVKRRARRIARHRKRRRDNATSTA